MSRTSSRRHGTYVKYVQDRCRCPDCRAAHRDYERQRARRVEPSYVVAGPARDHIRWLSQQGVGLKRIATASGVSHGALTKLLYGTSTRPPSKRIRPRTLERILAVTPADGAGGSRVPAEPTWRIVEQLLARGWTKTAIARAIGQNSPALQLGRRHVTRANATAIKALLDQPVPPRRDGRRPKPNRLTMVDPDPTKQQKDARERDQFVSDIVAILEERIDQRHWRARAACQGQPTWLFFPNRGDNEVLERAQQICATCPVKAECGDAFMQHPDGVFGGNSRRQRKTIQRERRLAAAS